MATQYDPIAKDESLNTTEQTPRNIADVLAEGLKGIEDALPPSYTEGDGIDISNDEISVDTAFTEASTRANIASGDTFSTILGKIKKFFTDLKTVAFTGAYSDLSGTPDLTNVAYKNAYNTFSKAQYIDEENGTTTSVGLSALIVGNAKASGTDKNSKGRLTLYSEGTNYANLLASNITAVRNIELPNASGTIALTSDVVSSLLQNGYLRVIKTMFASNRNTLKLTFPSTTTARTYNGIIFSRRGTFIFLVQQSTSGIVSTQFAELFGGTSYATSYTGNTFTIRYNGDWDSYTCYLTASCAEKEEIAAISYEDSYT